MLPLLVVFPISLSSAPYMQFPPPGFSWQWYERYLDDPQWIDATWRSLYIGAATAVLALALGVPLAFSLVRGTLLRPRAARSPRARADHRADHHPVGRGLRPVRQAEADRRMVRAGGGAHRAGAAVRRAGDGRRPARFRPRRSSRRPRGWAPAAGRTLAARHAAAAAAEPGVGRPAGLHLVVRRGGGGAVPGRRRT